MKVLFLYIAQPHQIFHSLPIAAEMSSRWPEIEVHVGCVSDEQEQLTRRLAAFYPSATLHYDRLAIGAVQQKIMQATDAALPLKLPLIWANREYLAGFDALVVPERTTLHLKRFVAKAPLMVWTSHGAGDRAIGYAADLKMFDFALLAGSKQEARMLGDGTITPGRYEVGCYAKFDLVRKLAESRKPLFANGRKTVLYSPHFRRALSSWHTDGFRVLDWFAEQDEYNLVFAPHVRLFDPPNERAYRRFERYRDLPHMKIDLGSFSSIDMTYTLGADIYLGDVSSQVTEFMMQPRPCVFIDSHLVAWQDSPNYSFWKLGPVVRSTEALTDMLAEALHDAELHFDRWRPHQIAYQRETFSVSPNNQTAASGADAVARFLLSSPENRPVRETPRLRVPITGLARWK